VGLLSFDSVAFGREPRALGPGELRPPKDRLGYGLRRLLEWAEGKDVVATAGPPKLAAVPLSTLAVGPVNRLSMPVGQPVSPLRRAL